MGSPLFLSTVAMARFEIFKFPSLKWPIPILRPSPFFDGFTALLRGSWFLTRLPPARLSASCRSCRSFCLCRMPFKMLIGVLMFFGACPPSDMTRRASYSFFWRRSSCDTPSFSIAAASIRNERLSNSDSLGTDSGFGFKIGLNAMRTSATLDDCNNISTRDGQTRSRLEH